jgi:hypothetical protein
MSSFDGTKKKKVFFKLILLFRGGGEEPATPPVLNVDPATWEGWLNSFLLWASKAAHTSHVQYIYCPSKQITVAIAYIHKHRWAPAPDPAHIRTYVVFT